MKERPSAPGGYRKVPPSLAIPGSGCLQQLSACGTAAGKLPRGGKVKNQTVANLSSWPEAKVEALARALKGLPPTGLESAFEIARSLPHGHVAAVLGTMRGLGMEELIDPAPSRQRDLVTAMIAAAVIDGSSKLATARGLREETAASSLGEVLSLGTCDEDDLYAAMDWLLPRQQAIESALAARPLAGGMLVLYDASSAAFEGRTCPRGAIGHARDGVRGRLQIVYGMLTTAEGIPVAVEVFKGNTGDPATLASQVTKLKQRFGLAHVAVVGDRGMLIKAALDGIYVIRTSLPVGALGASGAVESYKALLGGAGQGRHQSHCGGPARSFATLLEDLATITANRVQPAGLPAFTVITTPTPVQRQALDLLGVTCRRGYA